MSASYVLYTSPNHPPVPDHLPALIVTPYGKPEQILYTYLHTNYNRENYLLTPSPQGDLCVAKLFPPPSAPIRPSGGKSVSESGHGGQPGSSLRTVKCEASRNFKWSITNSGVLTPTYKCTLPSDEDGGLADEQPLFQISKTNPSSPFWTLWYYAYAGHLIPPRRIQFGHISKSITPEGKPITGGGTRVTITGKTDEEKAVWKTLGEGNEDMVEWAVICAALHALDDEIVKAAEAAGIRIGVMPGSQQKGGPLNASTPPMPHNMPRPQLHPTGQAGSSHNQQVQPARGPPVIPNSRGPQPQQQQQQRGPPPQQGGDPRMQRDPRMMQQQQPPQQPPQQPQRPPQQPPQQFQQQPPMQGGGPPAGQPGERQRLLSKNGPRPQQPQPPQQYQQHPQQHSPQAFSPPPRQQTFSPSIQGSPNMPMPHPQHQQQAPPQQMQMQMQNAPRAGMSPPINARPGPLSQQSNSRGASPMLYQNGQQPMRNGGSPMPLPQPGRSPLPAPGSSAPPANGMRSPTYPQQPMQSQQQQQQYHHPPSNGSRAPGQRPPSDPAQYSRNYQSQSDHSAQYGPPQSHQQQQQQQQRSPVKRPQQPPARVEEDEAVDSVAFMLGTTALNDATSYDDDDDSEAIGHRGNGGYQPNGGHGSRVNRLLRKQ